jgi:hypothetical protein
MRKARMVAAAAVLALVFCASAWAGTTTYAGSWSWPAGQAYSTSYSSAWWRNLFYKNAYFDTTVTFIDNTSYGWHATLRGTAPILDIHWFSSEVKKAHCHSNVQAQAWGACTAYN